MNKGNNIHRGENLVTNRSVNANSKENVTDDVEKWRRKLIKRSGDYAKSKEKLSDEITEYK